MAHKRYIAKTFHGFEGFLEAELQQIGAENIKTLKRAAAFEGDHEVLYRANFCCRTAISVLAPIHEYRARNEDELYRGAKDFPWTDIISLRNTFSIKATLHGEHFNHSQYVALKVKDAVADHFMAKYNKRPNVDPKNAEIRINLHISDDRVTISLDTSGDSLFKRGYRKDQWKAPMNECLAAGILKEIGYDGAKPLLDPMCGSGTIAFEAAMVAGNVPAGQMRRNYGFMHFKDFDEQTWNKVRDEAINNRKLPNSKITGLDIEFGAIKTADANLDRFPSKRNLKFFVKDFFEYDPGPEPGILIMNPPYDKRIESLGITDLYERIGSQLKHKYEGWEAWIFSGNMEALKHVGLKPSKKVTMYNGPLECRLVKYELYSGSKKASKQKPKLDHGS